MALDVQPKTKIVAMESAWTISFRPNIRLSHDVVECLTHRPAFTAIRLR